MKPENTDLPEVPDYCFCPAYAPPGEAQQIRIVVDGMSGFIPTSLVALDLDSAERVCDRFNARLGLDREQWTRFVARSMFANRPASGSSRLH